MKKYELSQGDVVLTVKNIPVFQIRVLHDFGNVKKEDCCVSVEDKIPEKARVFGSARIFGMATPLY
ncbi:MAG: hypothetical protein OEL89_05270 [Candidatus Peregrinibacteria bacterium]|nr:hypothetical protein [Candidatus Peregrinibacteria bacterium]